MSGSKRFGRRLALFALACGFCVTGFGCKDPNPGITDKPPPKGGPPKNSRKPPGEVNSPATR